MKCFLHIGTEKTGTKSLQNFLNLNREILSQNNIIFTKSAGLVNNMKLAIAAYDPDKSDDLTISMGIKKGGSDLTDFQQRIRDSLKQEIESLSEDNPGKMMIFSSEHFQSRLRRNTEIQRLKEILNELGLSEIKVIVYLRDPAEIANSLYSTAIKSGHVIKQPPPPDNPYFNHVCNHKNTLEKFGSVFGEHALIPRLFNKSDLVNGSIIEDFLDVTGIQLENNYILPAKMNETLSETGLNILRRVNEMIPRIIDDRINPIRSDLVAYFEKHFSEPKYLMPIALSEKYNDAFKDSNEWVRGHYFPHKTYLFPREPYQKSTAINIPEEETGRIASLISDIWHAKQNGKQ